MDDFIEIFENFIKQANNNFILRAPREWKKCIELQKDGWKITEYANVQNSDDIVVRWTRDTNNTEVKISFANQILWLNYLELNKKEKFYVK